MRAADDAAGNLFRIQINRSGSDEDERQVTKAVASVMGQRGASHYIMTGETFDGRKAAAMGPVNEAMPETRYPRLSKHTTAVAIEIFL